MSREWRRSKDIYCDTRLSSRELEVLQAVAEGLSNREIAARLGTAENTAKRHLQSIMSKLDVQKRAFAVTVALERGLMPSKRVLARSDSFHLEDRCYSVDDERICLDPG